jgi:fluoride exporter
VKYLLIVMGGGAGSLARYLVANAIATRIASRFPWGTVVVNVTGCFVIGLLMTVLTERAHLHPNWRFALVVGFLGGYTTFSSFEWETWFLARDGAFWVGLTNVIGSVTFGYVAVWLGSILARR